MALLDFDLLSGRGSFTAVAGICAALYLLYRVGAAKVHPNEPTVIPPKVPFVGHLLGMTMHGGKYVKMTG